MKMMFAIHQALSAGNDCSRYFFNSGIWKTCSDIKLFRSLISNSRVVKCFLTEDIFVVNKDFSSFSSP